MGPLAVESFSKIHADVAVMSAGGITLEGISNSHGLLDRDSTGHDPRRATGDFLF